MAKKRGIWSKWFRKQRRKAWRATKRRLPVEPQDLFGTQTHKIQGPAHGIDLVTGKPVGKGWSRTITFKTKVKRWTKRHLKKAWRGTKKRVRRTRKKLQRRIKRGYRNQRRKLQRRWWNYRRQRQRALAIQNRQLARNRPLPPAVQGVPPDASSEEQELRQTPPPDGELSICRLGGGNGCGNEIRFNAANGRWEHTGKGNAACFGK